LTERVAAQTGKLLSLNGDYTFAQVHRRLMERWGERFALTRAVQRILRSMVSWGTLQEGTTAGGYRSRLQQISVTEPVTLLPLEGLLHAEGHGLD